jgi:predicted nucleic acid-binding Zn ribbon protein
MKFKNKVVRLRKKNPFMRVSEIAVELGASKQRVWSILKRRGLDTNPPRLRPVLYCVVCNSAILDKWKRRPICSKNCSEKNRRIKLSCDYCTSTIYRLKSEVRRAKDLKYEHAFCNNRCYNKYKKEQYVGN